MKKLLAMITLLSIVSCGAITRDKILSQTIKIQDSTTKAPIVNATIKVNDTVIGKTDARGQVIHDVPNPNTMESLQIVISHPNYLPISLAVEAKPGGKYIGGDVALFLVGLVPGIVGLVVDGVTGTWYTYDQLIVLNMNAK